MNPDGECTLSQSGETRGQRQPMSTFQQRWPDRLWIDRHGERAGNVARDAAHAAGLGRIEIDHSDVDVPLSSLGAHQTRVLGRLTRVGIMEVDPVQAEFRTLLGKFYLVHPAVSAGVTSFCDSEARSIP